MNKTTEKFKNLMQAMSPCSKEMYYKEEKPKEMSQLQSSILNLIYNEEHAESMRLVLVDGVKHLKEINNERGNVADEYLERLEVECRQFDTLLGRELAGNSGEVQAFRSLETVKSDNITFRNLELCNGENRGELDAVVITSKAIFLIEVKNPGHDMIIDAKGNYYRAKGYMDMDYNIGEKINNKEFLLRKALEEQMRKIGKKMNIVTYVVFANSRIEVTNRYKYLDKCYLCHLPHLIDDYEGEDIYADEDMELMKQAILNAEDKKKYPIGMDIKQMKEDFAMAMALLEVGASEVQHEEIDECKLSVEKDSQEGVANFIDLKPLHYLGAAATLAVAIISAVTIHKHTK